MGDGESVAIESPFHNMKAVERTRAKLRTWVRACRGLPKLESMLTTASVGRGRGGAGTIDPLTRGARSAAKRNVSS